MIIIIYFILLSLPHTLSCMETDIFASARFHFEKTMPAISYLPYQIDPKLDKWRKQLDLTKEIEKENPDFKCVGAVSNPDHYRCFQYAMEHITGFSKHIPFPSPDALSIKLKNFFKQTTSIEKNNLIVYTCDEKNLTIKHFAVAISSEKAHSKCGAYPQIISHKLDSIFLEYGKAFWSFALKKKYQKDKTLLLHDINKDLEQVHAYYHGIVAIRNDISYKKPKKRALFIQKKPAKKVAPLPIIK